MAGYCRNDRPLAGLTAWYLVRHAGQSENDLVKINFVLGMTLVFVPIDVLLELGGDIGVLGITAIVIGLLIRLRQRYQHLEKSPPVSHPVT
jgi:membrane-bound ClpP family serine protease